jgi:hypothetical protein
MTHLLPHGASLKMPVVISEQITMAQDSFIIHFTEGLV